MNKADYLFDLVLDELTRRSESDSQIRVTRRKEEMSTLFFLLLPAKVNNADEEEEEQKLRAQMEFYGDHKPNGQDSNNFTTVLKSFPVFTTSGR